MVRSVDVDTVANTDDGGFTQPEITGTRADEQDHAEPVALGYRLGARNRGETGR